MPSTPGTSNVLNRIPHDVGANSTPPGHAVQTLWDLATAAFATRCLHVVADLAVADHIHDEPVPVGELAAAVGAHPDALGRVLRLLATYGIFTSVPTGWAHTTTSRLLRDDHPASMRAFARIMGLPLHWDSVTDIEHAIRTGAPVPGTLDPQGVWGYLQAHHDEARIFAQAMTAKARADIATVLAGYDFTRFATLADIGGGNGHLLNAVVGATNARGTLFDLPHVIDTITSTDPRVTLRAGDFFHDTLPTAEAYLLMDVLHDWPDHEATAILRAIRRAAPAGATVLVLETILPDHHVDTRSATLDIIMLTISGGRERTPRQLAHLFDRAGFRPTAVTDTSGPIRIAEATAI